MSGGRLFQTSPTATRNARVPLEVQRVRGTLRRDIFNWQMEVRSDQKHWNYAEVGKVRRSGAVNRMIGKHRHLEPYQLRNTQSVLTDQHI